MVDFVPIEINFQKLVTVEDRDTYINECCWGGDVVSDRLLPVIQQRFTNIQAAQEDWGWFIWFRNGRDRIAVDIFCDDPTTGRFRALITRRVKRYWVFDSCVDGPEAEEVASIVRAVLDSWGADVKSIEKVDAG